MRLARVGAGGVLVSVGMVHMLGGAVPVINESVAGISWRMIGNFEAFDHSQVGQTLGGLGVFMILALFNAGDSDGYTLRTRSARLDCEDGSSSESDSMSGEASVFSEHNYVKAAIGALVGFSVHAVAVGAKTNAVQESGSLVIVAAWCTLRKLFESFALGILLIGMGGDTLKYSRGAERFLGLLIWWMGILAYAFCGSTPVLKTSWFQFHQASRSDLFAAVQCFIGGMLIGIGVIDALMAGLVDRRYRRRRKLALGFWLYFLMSIGPCV